MRAPNLKPRPFVGRHDAAYIIGIHPKTFSRLVGAGIITPAYRMRCGPSGWFKYRWDDIMALRDYAALFEGDIAWREWFAWDAAGRPNFQETA